MITNKGSDNFEFEDNSYQDNYADLSGDTFDNDMTNLFEGSTTNLFESNTETQQGNPNMDFQQSVNPQMNMQNSYNKMNSAFDNVRERAGKVVENGGVKLSNKHTGIILIVVGILIILLVMGIHSCATKPKAVKQPTLSSSNSNYGEESVVVAENPSVVADSTESLHLILVGDDVPIDYTVTPLDTTGLITNKRTFVVDNQVVYCLDISMNVGTDTKTIKHFCNRNVFNAMNTGTVVNVVYQQVDANNIVVDDITI